jgi:hypothetical protein
MRAALFIGVAVSVALVACGDDKKTGGAGGTDPRTAVIDAWKAGGLTAGALEPAQAAGVGTDCKSTNVKALELLLCVYPSADAAKAAEEPGLAWVGSATGAVKSSGTVLVAVADRRKTEPSGKTINQLLKLTP